MIYAISIRLDERTVLKLDNFVASKKSFQSIRERPYTRAKAIRDLYAHGINKVCEHRTDFYGNKFFTTKINLTADQKQDLFRIQNNFRKTKPRDSFGSIVREAIIIGLKDAEISFSS